MVSVTHIMFQPIGWKQVKNDFIDKCLMIGGEPFHEIFEEVGCRIKKEEKVSQLYLKLKKDTVEFVVEYPLPGKGVIRFREIVADGYIPFGSLRINLIDDKTILLSEDKEKVLEFSKDKITFYPDFKTLREIKRMFQI